MALFYHLQCTFKKAQLFSVSILLSRSQTASSNSSAIWSYAKPQSHNRQNLKIISAYYLYTWNSFRYYHGRLLFFHCTDYVDMALHYTICLFYRANVNQERLFSEWLILHRLQLTGKKCSVWFDDEWRNKYRTIFYSL